MAKRKYFKRRAAVLLLAFFLSIGFVLLTRSCTKHETEVQKSETNNMIPAEEGKPIPVYSDLPDLSDLTYPFNTMSADWDSDTLMGWRHYEIPEEYQKYGCLPDIVQVYTYCLCRQRDVSYTMVLAMMEVESGYRWNAKSDKGAVGYLQVVPSQHKNRLPNAESERDFMNPYSNIDVAVDYLHELSERFYHDERFVLSCYYYGVRGAIRNCDDNLSCEYAERVLAVKERIEAQLKARASIYSDEQ